MTQDWMKSIDEVETLASSGANHPLGNAKTRCHVIWSWRLGAWTIFGRPPQGIQSLEL